MGLGYEREEVLKILRVELAAALVPKDKRIKKRPFIDNYRFKNVARSVEAK